MAFGPSYSGQFRNEKFSSSTQPPLPHQGESFLVGSLLPQKRDYRKWEAGGSHWARLRTWRQEVEKQNYFVPLSFLMEMNILVSCQRRAINISSIWFNSTFKLSDGNWCHLTLSRGSVYTFTFISQLKANFEIAQYRENKIHSAYLSLRKSEPDSRILLFSIRQSNSFIKLVNSVPCMHMQTTGTWVIVNWLTIFTDNTVN